MSFCIFFLELDIDGRPCEAEQRLQRTRPALAEGLRVSDGVGRPGGLD